MFVSILRRVPRIASCPQLATAGYCDAKPFNINEEAKRHEAPAVEKGLLLDDKKKLRDRENLSKLITIPVEKDIAVVSGIPMDQIKNRRVRISMPSKNCMQSGTSNLGYWKMEFDNQERWENHLMGWTSTGDPLSNMQVEFGSKEEAIAHCEKYGWRWYVDGEERPMKKRDKNYGLNYSWNKRTRVSTK